MEVGPVLPKRAFGAELQRMLADTGRRKRVAISLYLEDRIRECFRVPARHHPSRVRLPHQVFRQ
jgi:hypothetical protein